MRKKQEMTSQPTPHALKGITCTNDDPDSCAICFKQFPDGLIEIIAFAHIGSYIIECCGKRVCSDCCQQGNAQGASRRLKCKLCPADYSKVSSEIVPALKKHAKKGKAWAKYLLGTYSDTRGDYFEAVRFYRIAAKKGHPAAMLFLSARLRAGMGCKCDLVEAIDLLDRARSIAPRLNGPCLVGYSDIASKYRELNTPKGNRKLYRFFCPWPRTAIPPAN